jgi:hypothetical protein
VLARLGRASAGECNARNSPFAVDRLCVSHVNSTSIFSLTFGYAMLLVLFELLQRIRIAVTVKGSHFDSSDFPFAINLAKPVFVATIEKPIT